jgi:hypothetical protein
MARGGRGAGGVYWVIVGERYCRKTREVAVEIESRRRVRNQTLGPSRPRSLSLTLTRRLTGSPTPNRIGETRIIFGKIDGGPCGRGLGDDCARNGSDNGLVEVTVGH